MDLFTFKPLLFLLSFIGCCAGQNILPPGPVDAILGRNVTFNILVNNPVYAFIIWNFNNGRDPQLNIATVSQSGVKVNTPYQGRVSLNQTTGYLTLTSLKLEDSGDYSVSIISTDGDTNTGDIQLRVLKPVSDVVITSNLPEAIEYNSTVVLNCSAKGSFLTFSWTNGTTPIVPDGVRLTLKGDVTSSALTITGVLRTDLVGPIYCTAANNLETYRSAPFNLTVYYGPEKVAISPPNVPQFIRSDSNFNLSCSAISSPPATFTWYHNQQMIQKADSVLTLKTIKDNGLGAQLENYTCIANNAKTLRAVPSPAVSFVVMDGISGTTITGPTALLIAGNSTANLSCQATAGTATSTIWLKEGTALSASTRLVFSSDRSSLMINPLQKEDNGRYTCQLQNPVSNGEASYKMVVNFGPEQVKVKGVNKIEENQPLTLECNAESVPAANFTWRFNGTLTDVKTKLYSINKPTIINSGMYTCEAYNPVTGKTATYSHTLEVKAEGTLGTLTDGLSDGAIAGIVIAILVAVAAAIALTLYCRQKVPIESPY